MTHSSPGASFLGREIFFKLLFHTALREREREARSCNNVGLPDVRETVQSTLVRNSQQSLLSAFSGGEEKFTVGRGAAATHHRTQICFGRNFLIKNILDHFLFAVASWAAPVQCKSGGRTPEWLDGAPEKVAPDGREKRWTRIFVTTWRVYVGFLLLEVEPILLFYQFNCLLVSMCFIIVL